MALPDFTMRQLLEAGVHFGHQKHRWNPKMAPFIYGVRNNIHIIDLAQTVPMLHRALQAVSDTVAGGGRVLFVGTKRQAAEPITAAAKRSAQYYVNARWLGGMLTNWKTISQLDPAPARARPAARRRGPGPHQEGAPDAHPRARQARKGARRHQGHGRRARPHLRHRHQQGGDRHRGGQPPQHPGRGDRRFQLRSRPHHLSRSPAMTTPAAPSRSTATSSPGPPSTASRGRRARPASTSARRRRCTSRSILEAAAAGGRHVGMADAERSSRRPAGPASKPKQSRARSKPLFAGAGRQARRSEEDQRRRSGARGASSTHLGVTRYDQIAGFPTRTSRRSTQALNFKGRVAARRLGRPGQGAGRRRDA